jgi:hypothetical protein
MTEGFHEYHLCGDPSIRSELREGFFRKQKFEIPPEDLRDRMLIISEIMNIQDPYFVSVMTNDQNDVFNYRVEVTTVFNKSQLLEFQEHGFDFEEVIPRGESVVLYLKEMIIDEV